MTQKETAAPDREIGAAFQVNRDAHDRADAAAALAGKWIAVFAYCHGFTSLERAQEKFNLHLSWRYA